MELTVNSMSHKKIIKALNELREFHNPVLNKCKSKHWFALGYAKRAFEENKQLKNQFKELYDAAHNVVYLDRLEDIEKLMSALKECEKAFGGESG